MKTLSTKSIDTVIASLEKDKQSITEKINKKISEYDKKAIQKRKDFLATSIDPMQKQIAQLKKEIAKLQKVKNLLSQDERKDEKNVELREKTERIKL